VVALWNGADHYSFSVWFLLLSFFFSSPNVSRRRLDVCQPTLLSLCLQDKSGIPWWLGISCKGIAVYDYNDRKTPRRVCFCRSLYICYSCAMNFSPVTLFQNNIVP